MNCGFVNRKYKLSFFQCSVLLTTLMCFFYSQGWLKKRFPQEAEVLRELFTSSFSELYRFCVQSLEFKMDMLEAFVIMQCINMLQGLIPPKVRLQSTVLDAIR